MCFCFKAFSAKGSAPSLVAPPPVLHAQLLFQGQRKHWSLTCTLTAMELKLFELRVNSCCERPPLLGLLLHQKKGEDISPSVMRWLPQLFLSLPLHWDSRLWLSCLRHFSEGDEGKETVLLDVEFCPPLALGPNSMWPPSGHAQALWATSCFF